MNHIDEAAIIFAIAGWQDSRFIRAIRTGHLAFVGALLGYEPRAFTGRIKRARAMKLRVAKGALVRSQETIGRLEAK